MEITEVYMIFTSAFLLSILMLLKLILDKLVSLEKLMEDDKDEK